jgi:hypothetical protein
VILLGIGIQYKLDGIDTGNVVDLANLEFDLVDIDMSRVSASTLTLIPNPT